MSLIDKKALEKAIEDAGTKPAPLALAIGRDKDYIRDFLSGRKKTLKVDDAQAIAEQLHIPLSSLTGGRTDDLSGSGVEVVGKVAAGVYRDVSIEDQDVERQRLAFARDGRFSHARQYALQVEGDSMSEIIEEGSYVICVDMAESGLSLKDGMIVHVERYVYDGQAVENTLKEARREPNGRYLLIPRSANPSHKPFYANGSSGDRVVVRGVVIGKFSPFSFGF